MWEKYNLVDIFPVVGLGGYDMGENSPSPPQVLGFRGTKEIDRCLG